MPSCVDFSGRPFHFIGIGGIGMSALAYILAKRQLPVYGSDVRSSHITKRLQQVGAHIFWRQDPSNLKIFEITPENSKETLSTVPVAEAGNAGQKSLHPAEKLSQSTSVTTASFTLPQVICSTAIQNGNSEYQAALELGCPIFHRSDLLAALIEDYQSIAVAGTHGKTTTSSMVAFMLLETGLDPTIVVGGEVNAWEGNARLGAGPYLVAEADESDGSLVKFSAKIGIITNIELDHPDHYANLEQVIETFQQFANQCEISIGCIDSAAVRDQIKPTISYSLDPASGADYSVDCVTSWSEGTTARVWEKGEILGQLNLKLLGQHNLSNALATVALGRHLGLQFEDIAAAIAQFEGARRRFEIRGECNGILFVDDYAHHPSELKATLAAAKLHVQGKAKGYDVSSKEELSVGVARRQPTKRIVAIFQPHRYSRTLTFLEEFAQSFSDADIVVLSDIYSAGEPDLGQVSGQQLADLVATYHPRVYYQPSIKSMVGFLTQLLMPGDLALFLGAGNLNQIIPEVTAFYQTALPEIAQEERQRA